MYLLLRQRSWVEQLVILKGWGFPLLVLLLTACGGSPAGDTPTPSVIEPDESGRCVAFSVEDAQLAAAFDLVLPSDVPDAMELQAILLMHMSGGIDPVESCGGSDYAESVYDVTMDGERHPPIRFNQTMLRPDFPDCQAESAITIGDKSVRHCHLDMAAFYTWSYNDAIFYVVTFISDSPIPEEDIYRMIASVPEPGSR